MKQFTMTFNVEDDFEPGCCYDCPLHYDYWFEDGDDGTDGTPVCVLGCSYEECPIKKGNIRED